jgi:hypothetical protein
MKTTSILNPMNIYRKRGRIIPRLCREVACRMAALGMPLTESDRRLRELRNCHRGDRAFVLGNGPSLCVDDLSQLEGEITFASNNIYLAFDSTSWRPTYYSVSDVLVAENNRQEITALNLPKFFGSSVRQTLGNANDVTWLRELPTAKPNFSTDCSVGVHGGYSVVYHQLQLALHMGIREIYLIGLDFSFDVPETTGEECIHGEILKGRGEVNHFHKDYRKPGETWTMPRLDQQRQAFIRARATCLANHCRILNASRETCLSVFPRVDLDQLLKNRSPIPFPHANFLGLPQKRNVA